MGVSMRRFLFIASASLLSASAAFAEDIETCAARVRADFANGISGLEPMQIRDKALDLEKKLQDCGVELTMTSAKSEPVVLTVQPKAPLTSNGQSPLLTTQPYFGPKNEDDNATLAPIVPAPVVGKNPALNAPPTAAPHKDELKKCIDDAIKVKQDSRAERVAIEDREERNDKKHEINDLKHNTILACIQDFIAKQKAWKDSLQANKDHPITIQPIAIGEPPPGAYKIQPVDTTGDIKPVSYQPVGFVDDGNN